jgi:hypothetical protein
VQPCPAPKEKARRLRLERAAVDNDERRARAAGLVDLRGDEKLAAAGSPLIETVPVLRGARQLAHGFHAPPPQRSVRSAVRVHQHDERLGLLIEIPDVGAGAAQVGGQADQHQRAQRRTPQRGGKRSAADSAAARTGVNATDVGGKPSR